MESQMHKLAKLSELDAEIDELKEEYGDLPERIKKKQEKTDKLKALRDETQKIIYEIDEFFRTSKITLEDLKQKEEELSKKQFKVRNNKEFDAITKQIDYIKEEYAKLTNQIKTESLKKENLGTILAGQIKDFEEANTDLQEIKGEMDFIESDQNQELQDLQHKRKKIRKDIDKDIISEYERLREHHPDAAVYLKRGSCTGCFSSVPPQIVVEARNNLDKAYYCENCGRVLIPGEVEPE